MVVNLVYVIIAYGSGTRAEKENMQIGVKNRSMSVHQLSKRHEKGLFDSPKEKKVFVSTYATFLEDDYMTNYKLRSKVVLAKMLAPDSVYNQQELLS